jgi:hypothetical protein
VLDRDNTGPRQFLLVHPEDQMFEIDHGFPIFISRYSAIFRVVDQYNVSVKEFRPL